MKICFIVSHLDNLDDSAVHITVPTYLAKMISSNNKVEILLIEKPTEAASKEFISKTKRYRKSGINIFRLDYPTFDLHTPFLSVAQSFLIYLTLKKRTFDLIVFPDIEGLGYYSMLAKNLGLAFEKTKLALISYGPSEWQNRLNQVRVDHLSFIAKDYIEKNGYTMADHIFFPTNFAKKFLQQSNISFKRESTNSTIFYPMSPSIQIRKADKYISKFDELCFFGKIEIRTGIELFLGAISELNISDKLGNTTLTILGHPGTIKGVAAKEFLVQWQLQTKISLNIIDNLTHEQSLIYMKKKSAVAIMPYIDDFAGYEIAQCIQWEIPFICSTIPCFQEIIEILKPNLFWTFDRLHGYDLLEKIRIVLKTKTASLNSKALSNQIRWSAGQANHNQWKKLLQNLTPVEKFKKKIKSQPLSVCIIFFDRPEYLVQCLKSLVPINSEIKEILIYINSNEKPLSKITIEKIKANPKIRSIYGKQNVSPGFAYNVLTREAKSESLLFIDDDNLLNFKVFKKLWESVGDDWDIICCTLKKFHSSDLASKGSSLQTNQLQKTLETITFAEWLPVGASIPLSIFHNYIGDNNYLIKKSHLIEIGGVNEDMLYNEDAELIIRSIYNNGRYFLSPESFIFYRKHSQNLSNENRDFVSQDLKAMKPILNSIKSEHLLPLLVMSKNLNHYRDKNPDGYHLGQIELASKFQKFRNLVTKTTVKEINQVFRNKIHYNPKKRTLTCDFLPNRIRQNKKMILPNKTLHFIFYSDSEFEIRVNSMPFILKRGYNALTITFDQEFGINIQSKNKSIEFVEVKRDSFENEL